MHENRGIYRDMDTICILTYTCGLIFSMHMQNGVRGFMLDMYDFENDIWLCHSTGGQCYNVTSFVSLSISARLEITVIIK